MLLDTKQGQIRALRRARPVPIRREATGSFFFSRAAGSGWFYPHCGGSFNL